MYVHTSMCVCIYCIECSHKFVEYTFNFTQSVNLYLWWKLLKTYDLKLIKKVLCNYEYGTEISQIVLRVHSGVAKGFEPGDH